MVLIVNDIGHALIFSLVIGYAVLWTGISDLLYTGLSVFYLLTSKNSHIVIKHIFY